MSRKKQKQARLLPPTQRIRLALVGDLQQLDFRGRLKPRPTLFVDPLAGRQIEDPKHDLKSLIDRARRRPLLPAMHHPGLECSQTNAVDGTGADPGHQALQSAPKSTSMKANG